VDAIFERMVEQRVVEALEACDPGYVLETGRVALSGSRATLMTDPAPVTP
jgi:branched-chain amino acid transport system ATP-binding protein